MRFFHTFSFVFLSLFLLACESSIAVNNCEAHAGLTPICGLQAPEDIEVTPDERYLILSHFGGLFGTHSGYLSVFDTVTETHQVLFPSHTHDQKITTLWGDQDCDTPPSPAFSPHGIHLSQRADRSWQLLVVNHGNREAVEFFEWLPGVRQLHWRGCAILPEGSYLNDVVASPEGGLLVSHMFNKHSKLQLIHSLFGGKYGHVWYWRRGELPAMLANSRGSFTNGLQISPDGRYLFINMWGGGELVKVDRRSGTVMGRVAISYPDNSAWLKDGRLLVSSQEIDGLIPRICSSVENSYCPLPFKLIAVDPDTLETELIFKHQGAPMGAGTVAVESNNNLYIGSYTGNRMLKIPLK